MIIITVDKLNPGGLYFMTNQARTNLGDSIIFMHKDSNIYSHNWFWSIEKQYHFWLSNEELEKYITT